jgi:hypothetical protein
MDRARARRPPRRRSGALPAARSRRAGRLELAAHFRSHADDLLHHWHGQPDDQVAQADWQSAELGVHTWDLVRALGRPMPLDDEVAERGLAFMQQGLTDDNRGEAFGAPVDVPDDASAYDRLVAFAGRDPRA